MITNTHQQAVLNTPNAGVPTSGASSPSSSIEKPSCGTRFANWLVQNYQESLVVLLCVTGGYGAMNSQPRTSLADHTINPMLPDSPQACLTLLQDTDCTAAGNPEPGQIATEHLLDDHSLQAFLDSHFNSVDHPQWYQTFMQQEDADSAGENKCLLASDHEGEKYEQSGQQNHCQLDLPTGNFLSAADNFLPADSGLQKGIEQTPFSGRLTPDRDIFSLSDSGKSPFSANPGLPGINNKAKDPLSEFLEHRVTPPSVEATAYMQFKDYKDPGNVSGTKELLRLLVEKSINAGIVYSLLFSAFGGSSGFLTQTEFFNDFVHRGSIKLDKLFRYLLNKQNTLEDASQTSQGAVGGAASACAQSGNAEQAMGYAIARQIRREWPRNRGEKLDTLLANFPEPVAVKPARQPSATQRLLERGVPAWRGGATSVRADITSAGGTIKLTRQGAPTMLEGEELESLLRAAGIPRPRPDDQNSDVPDNNTEARDSDEDESMDVDPD